MLKKILTLSYAIKPQVAFRGLSLTQCITCGKVTIDAQMIINSKVAYQQVFLIHKSAVDKKNKLKISD